MQKYGDAFSKSSSISIISIYYICFSDPHSGIIEYDLCFGQTTRTCDILPWFKYDYEEAKLEHRYKLPDGIPIWVRIRAVNRGMTIMFSIFF